MSGNNYKKDLKGLMPDEDDRLNIVEFIKTYDMAYPYPHIQSIGRAIEEGLEETEKNTGMKSSSKDGMYRRMCLPQPFVAGITKAYPDLFSDETKVEWFLKNFPAFDLRA